MQQEGGRVQYIDASPHRKGSAYFAVYRWLLGDYQPYIYRTNDYGKTWTRLTDGKNGVPADWPTRVVREDPDREGLLYAGTEFGMFISFDNGAHWQSFQLNLPNVPVTDIKVHRKDLIVSTQGRSFWIIDDISSLHQLTTEKIADVRLFKPRDGFRTRTSPANLGPTVEYFLPAAAAEAVVLEILDEKGTVVNSYNSETPAGRGGRGAGGGAAPEAQPDDPDAPAGRRFGPPPPRVTKTAGLNRVVWDVRNKEGVILPPGRYQARLKIGSVALTEGFNVLIDPRVAEDGVTVADLQEQFEHNMRMRELVTGVNQLVTRVRDAQTKLRNAATPDSEMSTKVSALAAKLLSEPVRYGKPGLQAHITYLASMTANIDQKIGRDAIERYAILKKEFDAVSAEVDRVLGPAQPASDR